MILDGDKHYEEEESRARGQSNGAWVAVGIALLDKMIREDFWEERILCRDQKEMRDWDVAELGKPTQVEWKQVHRLWQETKLGNVFKDYQEVQCPWG